MNAPSPLITQPGTIIVLNGTSSAGKTSLASVLQEALLPTPYLSLGFDLFMAMLPPGSDRRPDSSEVLHQAVRAMHRAIRALSDAGSNIRMRVEADESPRWEGARGPAQEGPEPIESA